MKKIHTAASVLLMILFLTIFMTGCDSSKEADTESGSTAVTQSDAAEADGMQGYAGEDGASLENIDAENYTGVAKDLFGMELAVQDGWEIQEVISYNGVNNLTVQFTVPENVDGRAVTKAYFDQCLKIAENGICAQDVDMDAMTVSKGASYEDFEAFFTAEGTQIENFYSSMWLYDYGGKSVQCAVSVDTGIVEVTLTLLG